MPGFTDILILAWFLKLPLPLANVPLFDVYIFYRKILKADQQACC